MNFLFILFVTNQSGTKLNANRQASAALSQIFGVTYLSGQYFSIKGSSETTTSQISRNFYSSETDSNEERKV